MDRIQNTSCWSRASGLAVILLTCGYVSSAASQEVLRWKFTAGETWQVSFLQTANTETVGAGVPTTITLVMGMEMTWHVDAVAEDGTATLSQAIDRLTMSMKTGESAAVDYDSAVEPTSAAAKEIASTVGPLIGPKFLLTMSHRGEVLDVKLSEAAEQAVAANSREGLKSFFSAEGISRVLRQSVMVLPEQPLAVGDQWTLRNDVSSPLGTLEQVSDYTYAGPGQREGQTLEQIRVDAKLQVAGDAVRAKTSLKSQSQTGELWFDRAAGRLVRSEVVQKLTTERPYRAATIEVRSTSKLTTSFR